MKFEYNFLNLPQVADGGDIGITNIYDATGRKWQTTSTVDVLDIYGSPTGETYTETKLYLNGIEFVGEGTVASRLSSINPSSNGRKAYEAEAAESRIEYYHTDHLGNVRLAFSDLDGDNAITVRDIYYPANEIVQERHYYPFGLTHTGPWFATVAPDNAYRYNGKELDEATGLYDYGARYYDPAIARWGQVDPLAELMASWSPYNYTFGNPISFNDPTGMSPDDPSEVSPIPLRVGQNGNWASNGGGTAGPTNEYVRDKNGNYVQVGTLGGDEFDIVYDGTVNDDGSVTVAPGGGVSIEVEHITQGTSEMGFRFPGKKINSGGAGIATLDGFEDPIFFVIGGFATRGLAQVDDLTILGFAKKGKSFRAGSKKSRDGYLTSLAKEFQRWFHRYWKEQGAPNATKSEIDDALREWINSGKPDVK